MFNRELIFYNIIRRNFQISLLLVTYRYIKTIRAVMWCRIIAEARRTHSLQYFYIRRDGFPSATPLSTCGEETASRRKVGRDAIMVVNPPHWHASRDRWRSAQAPPRHSNWLFPTAAVCGRVYEKKKKVKSQSLRRTNMVATLTRSPLFV